ncbi:MAG: SIMPL domain-containing protein [Candidatus Sabulitectum sp.]|nr:SIMPL domain-containing protein [Candidatus Sabulitectum sp.]
MRILVALSAVTLLLTGCGDTGNDVGGQYQPYPPSVSVTGIGTATGIADLVVINFSIDVSDIDAGEAVNEATELAEGAIAAAVEAGVEEMDIETVGYSLYMEEEYDYNTYEYTGENLYHLTHAFTVKVNDIEQVGEVIAALVSGGATSIGGISFTISNRDELIAEAREMAIVEARKTAEHLASGLGVSLGDPINVSEWVDYYGGYDSYAYGGYADDYYYESPPISPGNSSVTLNVSVSYAID